MRLSPLEWLCFFVAVVQRGSSLLQRTWNFRAEPTCNILLRCNHNQLYAVDLGGAGRIEAADNNSPQGRSHASRRVQSFLSSFA
jgi:hypothetical protein